MQSLEECNHVLSFIGDLNYTKLYRRKIIPRKSLFTMTQVNKRGDFPEIMSKKSYHRFEYFVNRYIRDILHYDRVPSEKILKTHLKNSYVKSNSLCSENPDTKSIGVSFDKVIEDMKYYVDMAKLITDNFANADIEFDPKWIYKNIRGSPDLITEDTIYNITITDRFDKIRIQTIFQLLSYFTLARKLGKTYIKKIGLILPLQNQVISIDISLWNSEDFYNVVQRAIKEKMFFTSQEEQNIYFKNIEPHVGSHIGKLPNIWRGLMEYNSMPVQIFFLSPHSGKNTEIIISEYDILKTRRMTDEYELVWFVHVPYTINLSELSPSDWNMKFLKRHFELAVRMGAKGTVVHLGQKKKSSEETAKRNMRINVIRAAQYATEECPLLLETGAGYEIYSNVEELAEFYISLPEETKRTVAICVDTCHVYVSGYTPVEAITILIEYDVPIELVHYNDSIMGKGSKDGKHACIGKGKIGMEQLNCVGQWAIDSGIYLIVEE